MIKRLIILFLFFPVALSLRGQLQLGAEVAEGVTFFTPSKSTNGIKPMFKFGGFFRCPVRNLFLETGIYCGINSTEVKHFLLYDESIKEMKAEWLYWDVPLLLGHSFNLDKENNILLSIAGGLYAMYQYGGSATFTLRDGQYIELNNIFKENQVDINSISYDFGKKKRMDVGGRLRIDCNYKKWAIRVTASFGFVPYGTNYIDRMRQNSILLGLAYYLKT